MELVLIQSANSSDETIHHLKPGRNTLGNSGASDITVREPNLLSHHLDIENLRDSMIVSSVQPDMYFVFRGKPCRKAVIHAGESFSLGNVSFHCHAVSGPDATQHAMFIAMPGQGQIPAPVVSPTPATLSDFQVTAFVSQHAVTFPMIIGRNPRSDLVLNHPQVSAYHARLTIERGQVCIEDLHSSNGTFVSDMRIRKTTVFPGDSIVIMPYFLIYTGEFLNVYTFQRESKLIGWQVSVNAGNKRILEKVTLACASNELVGLIGPSGSGKTTLMKCMSGQTFPAGGRIQLNGLDMYSHFNAFKRNIGFVPQDDIIHRELTVHQTLMYAARLRLPPDMSEKERKTRVWETLIELELEEQERLAVNRLSGGQRKRVNIAIELLTKPGVLFLDEPTSGLDPALDEKLMILFKKLSQDGRITIMTTHLLEHAGMFSKIALMHYGRLIFFGSPSEATSFFGVNVISALYSKIKEKPAEDWLEQFQKTQSYQNAVGQWRDQVLPSKRKEVEAPLHVPDPVNQQISQWTVLSRRYLDIILRDHKNTGILLLQAPLIAFFIVIATNNLSSRLFMMTLAALWFGCNNSAREICKELPLYRRERMVNLSILPYLLSKFVILSVLIFIQCLVLALLTPDDFLRAYLPLLLCGLAGISMGLCISSFVDSPDKAIALVPILLIPQVLFSGIFGELKGVQRLFGEVMISKWSYNLMKKEFDLPALQLKQKLEKEMDENQDKLKESQTKMKDLQEKLQNILDDMATKYDPREIELLRYDANEINAKLQSEQTHLEDARTRIKEVERDLRANGELFVWVDHPKSRMIDWIALALFIFAFLLVSSLQLIRRDRLLIML